MYHTNTLWVDCSSTSTCAARLLGFSTAPCKSPQLVVAKGEASQCNKSSRKCNEFKRNDDECDVSELGNVTTRRFEVHKCTQSTRTRVFCTVRSRSDICPTSKLEIFHCPHTETARCFECPTGEGRGEPLTTRRCFKGYPQITFMFMTRVNVVYRPTSRWFGWNDSRSSVLKKMAVV